MKSYRFAIAFILTFIIVAHLVVGEQYIWYQHSISQLAGQAYSNAWIMRVGFIGFGVLVQIAGSGQMRVTGRYWYREVPIMLYGLSILALGIFSASPFFVLPIASGAVQRLLWIAGFSWLIYLGSGAKLNREALSL